MPELPIALVAVALLGILLVVAAVTGWQPVSRETDRGNNRDH